MRPRKHPTTTQINKTLLVNPVMRTCRAQVYLFCSGRVMACLDLRVMSVWMLLGIGVVG